MFMISAVVVLLGAISLTRLPVDLMPDVTYPSITVRVGYAGVGPLEIEEHSHSAMAHAYAAGAAGMPCAVFKGYRGSQLAEVNPNIKSIACPFTGESLAAVPAIGIAALAIAAATFASLLLVGIYGHETRGQDLRALER